jgi:hypothetical protein
MIRIDLPLRESKSVFTNVGVAPHRLQTVVEAVFATRALKSKSISTSALLQEKR